VYQGHRSTDPLDATFLDGNRINTRAFQFLVTYEFINQMWLEGWVETESTEHVSARVTQKNTTFGVRVRTEL
jgi:hypothetical protein